MYSPQILRPARIIRLWSSVVDVPIHIYMASRVESLIRRNPEIGDPRAAPTSLLGCLHQRAVVGGMPAF